MDRVRNIWIKNANYFKQALSKRSHFFSIQLTTGSELFFLQILLHFRLSTFEWCSSMVSDIAILCKSAAGLYLLFALYPTICYCNQPFAPSLFPMEISKPFTTTCITYRSCRLKNKGAPIKSTINNWKLTLSHFVVIMTCSYCLLRLVLAYNSPETPLNLNLLTIFLTLILWSLPEDFLWKVGNFHISKQHKSFSPMSSFLKFSFSCLNVLEIQNQKHSYQRVLGTFQILVEKVGLIFSKWYCNGNINTTPDYI